MNYWDCERYRKIRNEYNNRRWLVNTEIITRWQQIKWYRKYCGLSGDYMFSIYNNNKFIGGCSIYNINPHDKSAEFGRIIISQRGLGALITLAATVIAKKSLLLDNLYLEVKKDNIAAIKAYLKAGFVFENETVINGMRRMKKNLWL